MKNFDERDNMFSRMNLTPGSKDYLDYYQKNPEKKASDDLLREMPHLGEPGSATYHPIHTPLFDSAFGFLHDIKSLSQGDPKTTKTDLPSPEEMTKLLKGLCQFYGAKLTGISEMKKSHFYSHRGRETATYGDKVACDHTYGIVFAVEMDKEMILRAPDVPESLATVKGYVDAAVIGMMLSYYIRSLGYEAINHMDGNYLLVAPLVAEDAGLGEIGRHGLLITKKYGSRIRLGVVTTNLPLISDQQQPFGIPEFCKICRRCATSCPGKAIPTADRKIIDGDLRWKISDTECYKRWRMLGTDCGICLASCPFTHELDPSKVDQIKNSPEMIREILREFNKEFPLRPVIREPVDWFTKKSEL